MLTSVVFAEDLIIKDIQFEGLKRTRDKIALTIVRPVEIGDLFTDDTVEIIIQELRETKIFNPNVLVFTEITGDEVTIRVVLKD